MLHYIQLFELSHERITVCFFHSSKSLLSKRKRKKRYKRRTSNREYMTMNSVIIHPREKSSLAFWQSSFQQEILQRVVASKKVKRFFPYGVF